MLFSVESRLRPAKHHACQRREAIVEQLSLLVLTEAESATPVWDLLDDEQRRKIVAMLARLMARTVTMTREGEHDDE